MILEVKLCHLGGSAKAQLVFAKASRRNVAGFCFYMKPFGRPSHRGRGLKSDLA